MSKHVESVLQMTSFTYWGTVPCKSAKFPHADVRKTGPPCPSPASSPRRNDGRYNFCVTRSHLEFLGPSEKIWKYVLKLMQGWNFNFCSVLFSMLASKPCISSESHHPIIQKPSSVSKIAGWKTSPHLFRKVWSQVLWQFEPGWRVGWCGHFLGGLKPKVLYPSGWFFCSLEIPTWFCKNFCP